ncbi:MAG: redox-regulated ATPase YchF [Sulfolobaceae archaeon]
MLSVGIIGKTNVGKSTFFSAATLIDVPIENRPFVTLSPNIGIGYVKIKCVHEEFGVKCNPKNSACIEGFRFIPIKLIDVPGLIPGAHKGRGLGNKFLDELRKADVLIHVVDASGSTSEDGNPLPPGSRDPLEDITFVESEIDEWFYSIVSKDWQKFARSADLSSKDPVDALLSKLSGLSINKMHIMEALKQTKLESIKFMQWSEEDLRKFSKKIREVSKPILIAANKCDVEISKDFIRKMKEKYKYVVPTSAISELVLRKASNAGYIKYIPGEKDFKILKSLNEKQLNILNYIKEKVLDVYGSTGVQDAINTAVFDVLQMLVVFPVEDEKKLSDKEGNVLPDALLIKSNSSPRDLAEIIHTELAKGFLYAIDVRRRLRIGEEYRLKNLDVIKIVSSTAKT